MHFVELNKFKKDLKDIKTALDRWILFLNRAYELEKDKIPEELAVDEAVKKAVERLDVMYLDKEEREMYENDLKRLRDYIAEMKTAEIRGMEKEKEKSRLRDLERVLKLLTKKFGLLDDKFNKKIENLDSDKLNLIIENILDIENLEDVKKYL